MNRLSLKPGTKTVKITQPTSNGISPNATAGFYSWGFGIQLTEYETQGLEAALATGSGAAWVAAELSALGWVTLPASIPAGLIAAVLATGAGGIWLCDWSGGFKGITIGVTWVGSPMIYPN